jgi:CDGSH iron-sulfur domain-containing protein 3
MKLIFREDGSLGIETNGSYIIRKPDGTEETIEKPKLSICRCGLSANKPFCDSSHKNSGFRADPLEIEIL